MKAEIFRTRRSASRVVLTLAVSVLVAVSLLVLAGAPRMGQAAAPHVKPSRRVIRYAKNVVSRIWSDCRAFAPGGCSFGATAWTWDGRGRDVLYAIDLRKTAGDSCGLGAVYIFNATRLVTSTVTLAPHAQVANSLHAVSSPAPLKFEVRYAVNPAKNASCARYGSAGTDTYAYGWNGRRMILVSGAPPRPPKTLVRSFPPPRS
jgi:hypothetical protein